MGRVDPRGFRAGWRKAWLILSARGLRSVAAEGDLWRTTKDLYRRELWRSTMVAERSD